MMKQRLSILGSTGSIGVQTLDIVRENPDLFEVSSLTAHKNWKQLAEQAIAFDVDTVVIGDEQYYEPLRDALKEYPIKVFAGDESIAAVASAGNCDTVVNALVGYAGLVPTARAIEAHKRIALANKETLVVGGATIMPMAIKNQSPILPIDSEHSAIFQCLMGENSPLRRLIITCSGGALRNVPKEELANITAEQALRHPRWDMGAKITIDSATLVNKGLEVIEAKWLFDVDFKDIDVIVQPQSLIHSMVQFKDGGIMAQLGTPDMRLPIQYAIYYPERRYLDGDRVDFASLAGITFEKPDTDTFEGLKLAYEAGKVGGSTPTVFNAANELAVAMFLDKKIRFLDIYEIIKESMNSVKHIDNPSIEQILEVETETYEFIRSRWN